VIEHMRRRRVRSNAGFTLIELLVVITILGVLAAVVVFSVRGVTDKGQSAASATDAQTLRTAEEAYCAKIGHYAPDAATLVANGFLASVGNIDTIETNGISGPCGNGSAGPSGFNVVCNVSSVNNCQGAIGGGAVARGGTMVLAVGSPLPASTLPINPATTSSGTSHPLGEAMFNGLLAFDKSGNIVPDLATTVPSVANGGIVNNGDGTQDVNFTLRSGMVWQDNNITNATYNPTGGPEPITNADVAFSYAQALLIGQGRTSSSMGPALGFRTSTATFDNPVGGAINLFSVGGQPLGVDFHFLYPYSPLLRQMNVTEAPIIPSHVYAHCAKANGGGTGTYLNTLNNQSGLICPENTAPVGSGPFMFSSFTTSAITLVKNPQYFKSGLPYLSKVVLVPTGTPQTGLQAARGTSGSVDTGGVAGSVLTTPFNFTTNASYNVVPVPRGSGGGNCINTIAFNLWQPTNGTVSGTSPLPEWTSGLPGSNASGDTQAQIVGMPTNAAYDNPILSSNLVRKAMFEGFNRAQAAINNSGVPTAVGGPIGTARLADSIYDSNLSIAYAPTTFPGKTGAQLGQPDVAQANADLDAAGWDGGTVTDSFGKTVRTWGNHPTFPQQQNLGLTPGTQLKLDFNYNGGSLPIIGSQFISDMLTLGIDVRDRGALSGNSFASTANARNFEIGLVSYCDGDDPVVGVQRQFVSSAIPVGFAANTSGYRDQGTTPGDGSMDGLWYQANRATTAAQQTSIYGQIQNLAVSTNTEIPVDESVSQRVTRSICQGLNNQNTGLFVETAYCSG
jgi:peptide/nickel transport system substrate-binding protein